MQLVWNLHPKQINVQTARSAAYQYTLINYNDGRAELTVQHRGDRPSETPIKRFVYKNRNGAFGGAQRFENQHGYRDPAHHSPAEIVPFLPELHPLVRPVVAVAADALLGAESIASHDETDAWVSDIRAEYEALCLSVLCCRAYDCYVRTEIDTPWCTTHRETYETTED